MLDDEAWLVDLSGETSAVCPVDVCDELEDRVSDAPTKPWDELLDPEGIGYGGAEGSLGRNASTHKLEVKTTTAKSRRIVVHHRRKKTSVRVSQDEASLHCIAE